MLESAASTTDASSPASGSGELGEDEEEQASDTNAKAKNAVERVITRDPTTKKEADERAVA
jgi:hypothetical protein